MLEPGTQAPDFTAPDQHGNQVSLDDLAGKWIAMWWYPKASTPGWTVEGQGFRDRAPEFEAAGAVIVGASFDTVEEQKAFADKEDFPYYLLSDPDQVVGAAYLAVRTPDMDWHEAGIPRRISYLIDPDGVIAASYDLDKGERDLTEHSAELLAEITARS